MAEPQRPVRRGLPRTVGGDGAESAETVAPPVEVASAAPPARRSGLPRPAAASASEGGSDAPAARETASAPPAPASTRRDEPARIEPPRDEPRRFGAYTSRQWIGGGLLLGAVVLLLGVGAVFGVRWLLSLDAMRDFVTTHPGEYHLPEGAPVGLPAWLGWQHFFNAFLMVLIIRSGWQVRREKRPSVFWTSRRVGARKISLALWFHQSLDLLWLVNGTLFVVLLFATGQWVRIVPTSWEVFPNALSAGLQYVSLDWPTENGWVNYNSLQQLAYFTTVFVAAPLAAVTGFRMSGLWPSSATTLSRVFPVEWARKIHFPVMIYFVLFIVMHVVLVLSTGALRNLNHMYAAQDAVNWAGFAIFAVSILAIIGAWIAARPLILAPIARLFGTVGR